MTNATHRIRDVILGSNQYVENLLISWGTMCDLISEDDRAHFGSATKQMITDGILIRESPGRYRRTRITTEALRKPWRQQSNDFLDFGDAIKIGQPLPHGR